MTRWIISFLIAISAASFYTPVRAETNASLGTFNTPGSVTVIVVNKSGEQITIPPSETTVQLPAGKYQVQTWTMERTDEEGNIWKLTGNNIGKNGSFNIIEGREVTLSIGESIIPSLYVKASDSKYSIDLYLRGQLSEIVEITKNGSRPDAPELVITNAEGSYRETLTFAYG